MGQSVLLRLTMGYTNPTQKILKLYKKCLRGSWSLDFGVKGYKIFGLDGHTFNRRWIFLYMDGDNNYSISRTIFGYIRKLSWKHWILSCFAVKTTEAAIGGVL